MEGFKVKKQDAIQFFGNSVKMAKALGTTPQAIYQWGDYVPERHHFKIYTITKGKLTPSQQFQQAS